MRNATLSRRALEAAGMPLGECVTRARPGGGYLCGGGGGGSSSSSNQTSTTNIDKRQVVDAGGVGVSSDSSTVNVTTLDTGIVKDALATVRASDAVAGQGFEQLLSSAGSIFSNTLDASNQTARSVLDASNSNARSVLDASKQSVASVFDAFGRVVDLAGSALTQGFGSLEKSQALTNAAYANVAESKTGSIDNKTIIILGVAGAVAVAVVMKGKK